MIREDDSRRRRHLRQLDVEWNSDGWNMFVFFSFSLLFVLTCLHEWRVLERSGARAHLRGRTTCPFVVVVVVVVERARSLSPSHSLSFSSSGARALLFVTALVSKATARHPGNHAPQSTRRALVVLARSLTRSHARTHIRTAPTRSAKRAGRHTPTNPLYPILCCGRLAGVVLLAAAYGRLDYGITDRVTRRAVRGARDTTSLSLRGPFSFRF